MGAGCDEARKGRLFRGRLVDMLGSRIPLRRERDNRFARDLMEAIGRGVRRNDSVAIANFKVVEIERNGSPLLGVREALQGLVQDRNSIASKP